MCVGKTHARKYPIIVNVLESLMTFEIIHESAATFETLLANSKGIFMWNNNRSLVGLFRLEFI